MKHHDPFRPVGRCKGCCLNLRTECAAGLQPKVQWGHGRCKHYGDQALLKETLSRRQPEGAKLARLVRKAKAVANAAEPHYNGHLDLRRKATPAARSHR